MGTNEDQAGKVRASRWVRGEPPVPPLERVLLAWLLIHAGALLATALLLLPGVPGGPHDGAGRMAYVAGHPWFWRLGWLPWQLAALVNLLLALIMTRWRPRFSSLLTLLATIAAVLPDQVGQFLWVTSGIALAQTGDLPAYLAFEHRVFLLIAAWGSLLYTLAALGWTWCFASAGLWRRWLTWYSALLWTFFLLFSMAPLVTPATGLAPAVIAAANGLGFLFLLFWVASVLELLLRRSRPNQPYGREALWRHPSERFGRLLDVFGNSRAIRALGEFVPVVALVSDIRTVLYVNYLVEAERVEGLVPPGLELQRLGPEGRLALLTFLSFQHGHLGPKLLGPLRRLLPSPVQTNWRLYVFDPHTGSRGIYCFSNAISSTLHALAARMCCEGLPMHVLARGEIQAESDGCFHLHLDPGAGSAPDAGATLCLLEARPKDGPWRACFESYADMLAYVVPQGRALSVQPWYGRVTRQEITLGIPLDACEPLEGEVYSSTASAIVGDAEPFCFYVARVHFRLECAEYEMHGTLEAGEERACADAGPLSHSPPAKEGGVYEESSDRNN